MDSSKVISAFESGRGIGKDIYDDVYSYVKKIYDRTPMSFKKIRLNYYGYILRQESKMWDLYFDDKYKMILNNMSSSNGWLAEYWNRRKEYMDKCIVMLDKVWQSMYSDLPEILVSGEADEFKISAYIDNASNICSEFGVAVVKADVLGIHDLIALIESAFCVALCMDIANGRNYKYRGILYSRLTDTENLNGMDSDLLDWIVSSYSKFSE